MPDPDTISADYTLRPSELAPTLALLVEARQPVILWGAPGSAKSAVAQQVAADAARQYVDVRALLLDPVDLRGIPWRDSADRTRWAPPAFLPPTDDPGRWLINSGGAAVGGADGASGSVPTRPRPQGRRIRTPRGRIADRLRQPRIRSRGGAPHADAIGIALRPSGDQGRCPGLVRLGRCERNLSGGAFLHPDAPGPPASVRSAIEGEGLSVPPDLGVRQQHRQAPGRH